MKRPNKKAFIIAGAGYAAVVGLTCGMLRIAQVTRRTLYGGQPVLAQVIQEEHDARKIALGGGEWEIALQKKDGSTAQRIAAVLPPGLFRWVLRLSELTDQTAEYIIGCE